MMRIDSNGAERLTASSWRTPLRLLKCRMRQFLKEMRRGYGQDYAQQQAPINSSRFNYLWSQCQTPIKQRSTANNLHQNRLINMSLAAQFVDGLIIQPQQIFGFWRRVPQPTIQNGFQAGPMLIRGRLTTDAGGGLCQISTTLFGAFLAGNLEILERSNHSVDTYGDDRFFTLGQDAAVVYGYKDLVARNLHTVPLQLRLQVDEAQLTTTASLWGPTPLPFSITLNSEVIQSLPAPADGIPGWQVRTQRLVKQPDSPETLTYQTEDTYQPSA